MSPRTLPDRVQRVRKGDLKVTPKAESCDKEELREFPHAFSLHLFRHRAPSAGVPFVNYRVLRAPASPDSCDDLSNAGARIWCALLPQGQCAQYRLLLGDQRLYALAGEG